MARQDNIRKFIRSIRTSDPREPGWHEIQLGGTTVYARNKEDLLRVIGVIESAIERVLLDHLTLPRNVLKGKVKEAIEGFGGVSKGLFGAILGRMLRLGVLKVLPCLTVNGKIKRVYIHSLKYEQHKQKVADLTGHLKKNYTLNVKAAHHLCFPENGWATYFMAEDMLGHLAYRGLAVYEDKDLFIWPQEIEDAVCNPLE